jgi:hypothetical protein
MTVSCITLLRPNRAAPYAIGTGRISAQLATVEARARAIESRLRAIETGVGPQMWRGQAADGFAALLAGTGPELTRLASSYGAASPYGRLHTATGLSLALPGFSGTLYVKAWLTTLAFVLALVQIFTALVLEGRIKVDLPKLPAVLFTVPVAVHWLYALGYRFDDPRVLVHSLVGCLLYGALTAKMLLLTRPGLPRWAIPAVGGVLFSVLVALWLTSSLWVFTTAGFHL